jgi:hypothetical protein
LAHANLLLTNVMILLRPIRIKNRQPDGPRTYTLADKCQWHLKKVRRLKASLVRGVKEIENGEYLLARTTFMHAREAWRADSPLIRFPERG